jgi:signal peptidase I
VTATARLVSFPRWLVRLVTWTLVGIFVGGALAIAAPRVAGYHTFTVMSGSMHPAIATGDVVVDKPVSPLDVHVGDVVTFRDPQNPRKLITHRVRALKVRGNQVSVVTKGDANNVTERWNINADGRLGRVAYHIPKVGYLAVWMDSPGGRFGFVVIPALLLAAALLVRIWRPAAAPAPRVEELASP